MADHSYSNYQGLAHLVTLSMLITDDGAIAISALSHVYFENDHLVIELLSGSKITLSESATAQFLDQTSRVAQAVNRQANSPIVTPFQRGRS